MYIHIYTYIIRSSFLSMKPFLSKESVLIHRACADPWRQVPLFVPRMEPSEWLAMGCELSLKQCRVTFGNQTWLAGKSHFSEKIIHKWSIFQHAMFDYCRVCMWQFCVCGCARASREDGETRLKSWSCSKTKSRCGTSQSPTACWGKGYKKPRFLGGVLSGEGIVSSVPDQVPWTSRDGFYD